MPPARNTPDVPDTSQTLGRKKVAALFTIADIDENIRQLLDEKEGLFNHRAMIDYWLELRHQHMKRIERIDKANGNRDCS